MKIAILCCMMIFGAHSFSTIVAMPKSAFTVKMIDALRKNNIKYVERTIQNVAGMPFLGLKEAALDDLQSAFHQVTNEHIENEATEMLKVAIDQPEQPSR